MSNDDVKEATAALKGMLGISGNVGSFDAEAVVSGRPSSSGVAPGKSGLSTSPSGKKSLDGEAEGGDVSSVINNNSGRKKKERQQHKPKKKGQHVQHKQQTGNSPSQQQGVGGGKKKEKGTDGGIVGGTRKKAGSNLGGSASAPPSPMIPRLRKFERRDGIDDRRPSSAGRQRRLGSAGGGGGGGILTSTDDKASNFAWSAFQSSPHASTLPLPAFGTSPSPVAAETKTEMVPVMEILREGSMRSLDNNKSSTASMDAAADALLAVLTGGISSDNRVSNGSAADSVPNSATRAEDLEAKVIAEAQASATAAAKEVTPLHDTVQIRAALPPLLAPETIVPAKTSEEKQEGFGVVEKHDGAESKEEQVSTSGVNLAALLSQSSSPKTKDSNRSPQQQQQQHPSPLDPIAALLSAADVSTGGGGGTTKDPTTRGETAAMPMHSQLFNQEYPPNSQPLSPTHSGMHQQYPHHPQQQQQQHYLHHQLMNERGLITINVRVPPALLPGRQMIVQTPGGYPVPVIVPEGVQPGMVIPVTIPSAVLASAPPSPLYHLPPGGTLPMQHSPGLSSPPHQQQQQQPKQMHHPYLSPVHGSHMMQQQPQQQQPQPSPLPSIQHLQQQQQQRQIMMMRGGGSQQQYPYGVGTAPYGSGLNPYPQPQQHQQPQRQQQQHWPQQHVPLPPPHIAPMSSSPPPQQQQQQGPKQWADVARTGMTTSTTTTARTPTKATVTTAAEHISGPDEGMTGKK